MFNFQSQPNSPPFNYICRSWMNEENKCEIEDLFVLEPQFKDKYSPSISRFCYPYEENDIQKKSFFLYCLTDADKNYSYCFSYVTTIPGKKDGKEESVYTIFSIFSSYYHPYFLNEIIFEVSILYNQNLSDCQSFIDHFSRIVLTQDKYDWSYDDYSCMWQNDNSYYELKCNRLLSPQNEISSCLKFMFENFSAHYILSSIVAMMNDYRIIILSTKPENLGKTCFGLLSLIYPIKWNGTFIPVLPSSLSDMLDSPIAYIDGVHSSMAEHMYTQDFGSYFVINFDLHSCASIEYNDFPDCVINAINSSSDEIKCEIMLYKSKEIFPTSRIMKLLKRFVVKVYTSLFEITPIPLTNNSQENLNVNSSSENLGSSMMSSIADEKNIYNTAYADPYNVRNMYMEYRNEFDNDMKYSICQTQFSLQFFRELFDSSDDDLFHEYFPREMKPRDTLFKDESEKIYDITVLRSVQTNASRNSPILFNQNTSSSMFDSALVIENEE